MRNFVAHMARKLHVPSVEEREMAYLSESRDHYDLEYRQREIDRGLFRNQNRVNWL